MEKFTKHLRWLLASLLLVAGVSAWAQSTSTLTFTAKCNGSGTADDNVAWTVTSDGTESNFDGTKGIHYGTGSAKVQYIKLTTSDISGTITKVVVNASTASGVSATASVTVGGLAFGGDAQSLSTSATDYTFEGSATGEIIVTVTKPSSAAKALYVKSVAVTYTSGGGTIEKAATPTFSPAAGTYTSAQSVELNTTTAGATIYYTTDGTDPTTSSSVYASAINVSTTTTIKAIAVKEGMDNSTVASATYTIVNIEHAGTEADPYTVAEARAAIDAGTGITGVYVKGIVSEIVTAYNSQYGNITYNITEDGTTDGDFLQAYRGKSYNGDNFTSADDIQVGDEVVIYGNLKKYNTTYEFEADNQLVSNSRTAPDTRTETDIVFQQDGDDYLWPSGSSFTITVGDTYPDTQAWVRVNAGATLSRAKDNLTCTGDNDAVGTVNASTGSVTLQGGTGTLTVTVSYPGDETHKPCTGYYTLKVNPAAVTPTGTGDEITYDFIGVSGTSYTDWSDKTGASGAVYAGNSAGGPSNTNTCVQLRSKNSNSGIVTTTSAGKVTLVTVEWNSSTSSSRTLDIYGSNTAYTSAADLYSSDTQGTKLGSICIDDATQLAITGDYAYIGIRSNDGAIYCDKITIYWETTSDERTATTTSFNAPTESYEVTLGEAFTAPTATLDPAAAGSLIYESSDPAVATVDANTGAVEILAAGTTTITAKFEGNNNYKSSQASYTITVTDPNAKGTETNPYTVAEVLEIFANGTLPTSEVYVAGIVSEIKSLDTSKYSRAQYYISDDGTTTDQFLIYNGYYLDGADFTSDDQLMVGDEVTVCGTLTTYGSTNEMAANNKIVAFNRPAAAVEAPVFSVDGGTYTEDQTVTITCATTGASIYYTLDGTEPTTASTPYTAALTISETTTLKAIASDGTNVSTVTTATYTINKVEKPYALNYGTEYYTKVTDLSQLENGDAVIIVNDSYNFALSTNQQTNNRKEVEFEWMPWIGGSFVQLADNSTVEKFILVKEEGETDASYYFYASRGTADGYIYAASSSGNQLKTSDTKSDNAKATITIENGDVTIKFQGSNTRNQLMYNSQSGLFSCYTSNSNQQSVQLYVERPAYVSEADQQVTVADAQDCYKTFITPYDARFDGVNDHAYIVTLSADQKQAILKEVSVVPAGTPIIYKYETAGTHSITRAISGSDVLDDVSDNVLKVSRGEVTGDGTIFVLNNVSGIGFYRLNEGKTLSMGKCYIKVEQSAGVKFIGINFDGDATGIATVDSEGNVLDGPVFNLAGQRVAVPAHGLYIVNGKKVFIK